MTVLSDKWIKKMALEKGMIKPFVEKQTAGNNISFGLSSFGYDARVSDEFKIFRINSFRVNISKNLKLVRNSGIITKRR